MRRRKPASSHANHERWLVSYADFITLLFAFFVVLYASAEMDKKKVVQLSAAIEGAFQQLGALSKGPAPTPPYGGLEPPPALTNIRPLQNTDPGGELDAYALQKELEEVLGSELKQHEIEMRVTPEGLVLSLHEVGFFATGQARILPTALPKLGRIAKILNSHGFDIRVEGHTDDVPIHNAEFNSNWELSTARATQVVTLLVEDYKLDPLKVAAAGYGQYRPVATNATPEGRQMNRRVDVVITSRKRVTTGAPESPADAKQPETPFHADAGTVQPSAPPGG